MIFSPTSHRAIKQADSFNPQEPAMRALSQVVLSQVVLSFVTIAVSAGLVSAELPASNATDSADWTGFGHRCDWKSTLDISDQQFLNKAWSFTVGEGYAQIVGMDSRIYVASGNIRNTEGADENSVVTTVSARSLETGGQMWSYETENEMNGDQETFGGVLPSPRSTPLLIAGKLILCTFTGQLICLDSETGVLSWQHDLFRKFQAQPVQFGFSSSPVACPDASGDFVMLAAGKSGGLIRMSAGTGEIVWISPISTFSYATPVLANIDGVDQWIVVSRNAVIGVANQTGRELWRFDLKEKGLTNVPTPLVLGQNRILVSGQGIQGSLGLKVLRDGETWKTSEQWINRLQFFYTNWIRLNDKVVLGCTDKYLAAFDCEDGAVLGRWRGYSDGNLLQLGQFILLMSGQGECSIMSLNSETQGLTVERKYNIGKGTFWTAPSVIQNRLLIRFDNQLHCYCFSATEKSQSLPNKITANSKPRLAFKVTAEEDPVMRIFREFEQQGVDAALVVYQALRSKERLTAEQRIELAEAAWEQGLKPLAMKVMKDAQTDLPESKLVKNKIEEWSR